MGNGGLSQLVGRVRRTRLSAGGGGALGEHALPVVCGALGEHALPFPPTISGGASFKAMECNSQFLRVGVYRT